MHLSNFAFNPLSNAESACHFWSTWSHAWPSREWSLSTAEDKIAPDQHSQDPEKLQSIFISSFKALLCRVTPRLMIMKERLLQANAASGYHVYVPPYRGAHGYRLYYTSCE
jgi:hypothetical protein